MPRLTSTISPTVATGIKETELKSSTYGDLVNIEKPRGLEEVNPSAGKGNIGGLTGVNSIFSNYHVSRFKSIDGSNVPLTDSGTFSLRQETTASMLVKNPVGASVFEPEDFLYADQYGKIPLTRLVTLRRFSFPTVDDIFSSYQTEPDICRLITFMDQDKNKLSEFLSFSVGMRWKLLQSTIEQSQMHGDQGGLTNGYIGKILKYVDPVGGQNAIRGETANTFNPYHDSNRVYGPVDSIDSTHIREQGLDFNHEFTLEFDYEIRSFEGLAGKAVFMDLLAKILLMTTNDAKFWGGARYWVGPRPTTLQRNLKFLSANSWNDFLNKSHSDFKGFLGNLKSTSREDALSTLKSIANNILNLTFGKLLDKLGRPGIPYMNSLLTNSPVGLWHLTVGDPLNPIVAIGNLILTNSEISFSDNLGIDGMPEEIKVKCTLKHATPRGRAEVENMFNCGAGRIYFKPEALKIGTQKNSVGVLGDVTKGYFGGFDRDAVLRNAADVYSFDKEKR